MSNDTTSNRGELASEALSRVEAFIGAGDLLLARRTLLATEKLISDEPDRSFFEAISQRLTAMERTGGPIFAFEAARERGDFVSARAHAMHGLQLAEGEQAIALRRAVDQCTARIRADWRIGELEIDAPLEDALVDCGGELGVRSPPPQQLTDGGELALLFAVHDRWLFIRELQVATKLVRRAAWLRAPESVESIASVQVDDHSIWLFAENGFVLQLSRRPLDILRWSSLRQFMLPDRTVSDGFVAHPGRFLWAEVEDPGKEARVVVVDLEQHRVIKRPDVDRCEPIMGARPLRIFGSKILEETSELFDERGERLAWAAADQRRVEAIVAHPNGSGFVTLSAVGDEDGDPVGLVEMLEGRASSKPLIVAGSSDEAAGTLAVSRDARLIFLLTHVDHAMRLIAYRSGINGLEQVWSKDVSNMTQLIQTADGRAVAAISATPEGIDIAVLGRTAPEIRTAPRSSLVLDSFFRSTRDMLGSTTELERELLHQRWRLKKPAEVARWAENARKERRDDPPGLAMLTDVLLRSSDDLLAENILSFAVGRHGDRPRFSLSRAKINAAQRRWSVVEATLAGIDTANLDPDDVRDLHRLWAAARLHSGDAAGALQHLEESAPMAPFDHATAANLALARALLEAPDGERKLDDSAERRVVQACRLSDAARSRGDHDAARRLLDVPAVHAALELQTAARLADVFLDFEPDQPLDHLRKMIVVARFAATDSTRAENLTELGWTDEQIARSLQRARAWMEMLGEATLCPVDSAAVPPRSQPVTQTGGEEPPRSTSNDPNAPATHSLPLLAHERIRLLVPGFDDAVRKTVSYVRSLPEWGDTQTLGDDLIDLAPVRRFLAEYRDRLEDAGASDAAPELERLGEHFDEYINFELHRKKLFFADASLALMLLETSPAIEGHALRVPFPCFGLVFNDRATLELGESLRREAGKTGTLEVMTVYVKQLAAAETRHALRVTIALDTRRDEWPHLRRRELAFGDDDDLEKVLANQGGTSAASRRLLHLVVNAILYANSAGVAWPIARSQRERARAQGKNRGSAKRARVANRLEQIKKQYSGDDVFYLPGRIPISHLRNLEQTRRGTSGHELMARFMVRGHWRRANPGWRDTGLRWIEPHWRGPDLAAIIEKEYKLKL
jgi:hypothetical protein